MINRVVITVILIFHFTAVMFAQQRVVFKKHLFLGTWQLVSDKHNVTEEWIYINDSLYTGRAYTVINNDTTTIETLQLRYVDNIFCYCSTVPDQNEGREIIFRLKHIENHGEKLTFENQLHDYPQKIIYEFSPNNQMTAIIEGISNGIYKKTEFNFKKIPSLFDTGVFTGKLIKETFYNKAGKEIKGVFDYFVIIEDTHYFVRFKESNISLKELEKYLEKEVCLKLRFRWGLWDTDDENVQSRIGRYVEIMEIVNSN
jgi:hypothetical protein